MAIMRGPVVRPIPIEEIGDLQRLPLALALELRHLAGIIQHPSISPQDAHEMNWSHECILEHDRLVPVLCTRWALLNSPQI